MNVVASSASSALTPAARSLKPSTRPPSARKKTLRSSSRSTPVRRLRTAEDDARAAADDLRGQARRRQEDAQRAALEEAGEAVGRVEEVQRVARRRRVEDDDVEAPRAVELVELGHRGELLRAGDRSGELLVDAVGEDLVARALVGRQALDELVERPLGVEHHRPQLAAHLDAVAGQARGVDEVRLVAELVDARARSASRRAGSIVTTATRAALGREAHGEGGRRRRLADAARARADDDALAGQARSHSAALQLARQAREPRRRRPRRRTAAWPRGARAPRRRRRSCAALGAGARVRVARSADLRAVGRRCSSARASAAAKRWASMPLTTTRPTSRPMSSRSASLQGERLVDRHLLGPGHRDDARPCRVGDHRVDRTALAGDAAHARGLREGARRAQHGDAVAGGGRVEDDEVVGLGARRAAVVLRELPDLADRQQLAHARRRGREVAERAARRRAARPAPRGSWSAQVHLHRVLGVDRQVVQAGRELLLVHARRRPGRARRRRARATSATIVRSPRPAATSPSAAATVVLPTPPLPRDDDQLTAQQGSAQTSPSQ